MIIDAHCHVWPDAIAARVLAGRPAGLAARHDGTVAGLLRTLDGAGIDMAVCLGVAAEARALARTNEFIGALDRQRFIPFGTVHPEVSVETNLASLQTNGIVGVKLHPLFQQLSFRDPRVVELMCALAEAGLPVLAHAGAGGSDADNERGAPEALRSLLDRVPSLRLIACHFGGYHRLTEARQSIIGSTAFIETSWPPELSGLDLAEARAMIGRHGARRVVFGSDWPMTDPAAEIAAVRALGLEPADEAAVLGGTIAELLSLNAAPGLPTPAVLDRNTP
ncbi:amidohydrolase family protein [Dactylosporangium sp. NPDC005572]|uniref:amidohydrolase family protein n=1 Tax=Dactylosporangium sp. NPDC005572 TaxID=3156889 RepID=UPI0033AFDB80